MAIATAVFAVQAASYSVSSRLSRCHDLFNKCYCDGDVYGKCSRLKTHAYYDNVEIVNSPPPPPPPLFASHGDVLNFCKLMPDVDKLIFLFQIKIVDVIIFQF